MRSGMELKMDGFVEYGNETLPPIHMNAVVNLISLMSVHFLVRSFTLISDVKTCSIEFQKESSKYNFQVGFDADGVKSGLNFDDGRGYLILKNLDLKLITRIARTRPKVMAVVFFTKGNPLNPWNSLSDLVIPPRTSFFLVILSEDKAGSLSGNCFRIYKPVSKLPSQAYQTMTYSEDKKWQWDSKEVDWGFSKKSHNISGVRITVALVTHMENGLEIFLNGKNSFFWRELAEYLKYSPNYHLEKIAPMAVKSITTVYIRLLMTKADGLAILPVITAERARFLEFVTTGLDSKYHIMVRTPQFIHSWQSILKPLAPETWVCLGILVLLIALAFRMVAHVHKFLSMDLSCCLLISIGYVCCQSSSNIPRNLTGRMVCYTALFFSILIYQYYTSNFYSLLSTKEVSLPFTSLEQFLAKRTHSMHVHPDTGIYNDIVKAKNGTFKRLWDEVLRKDPSHKLTVEHRDKALEKVCKGTGAIFGLPFQVAPLVERKCRVVLVNSGYFPMNIVTIIRKKFPFKAQFNFVQLRLLEAGISHKFRDKELNGNQRRATKTDVINEPVSLEHIAFPLVFYASAVVLSFLVLALEIAGNLGFKKTDKGLPRHKTIAAREKLISP